jgi:galactokinase
MNIQDQAIAAFTEEYGGSPMHLVRAPGRVNLIGEHTDYNGGFSLPMAIDQAIWIALRPRSDNRVILHSVGFSESVNFELNQIEHATGWKEYVHGMAWALKEAGLSLKGWEGLLISDIPVASGLSSSAALELAVARAFWVVNPWDWDGKKIAEVAKKHENEWMGLQSGILDQMISAIGKVGQAFLLDFKDLSHQAVSLPLDTTVVVLNTKVKRGLIDSAYNERVAQCQAAAKILNVQTLRDVTMEQLLTSKQKLDALIFRRARHVVSENARTIDASNFLNNGDVEMFGELMNASHASLRDDYEVSCVELDLMVKFANQQKGCYGARMTGAGFGGCAIALVETRAAKEIAVKVANQYQNETGITPSTYLCQSANGAEVVL